MAPPAGHRSVQLQICHLRSRRGSAKSAKKRDPLTAAFHRHRAVGAANRLTLCTGSLGAGFGNDLPAIAKRFAQRIHFVHLRNVSKEADGSFEEADHLGGDVDIVAVMVALLEEQQRRQSAGAKDWRIPFRPDHGHVLLDDANRKAHPGYPLVGRMRGLAELRGVDDRLDCPLPDTGRQ